MTITIATETEIQLRAKAEREGQDMDAIADAVLRAHLEWEARDREDAIVGIQRGLESSTARRVRSASEVFADMRATLAAAGR